MAEQWHWKHRSELRGPFSTSALEEIIRTHKLGSRDLFRLEGDDKWYSCNEIKRSFEAQESRSSAKVAAEVIGRKDRVRRNVEGHVVQAAARPRISIGFGNALEAVGATLGWVLVATLRLIEPVLNLRAFLAVAFMVSATGWISTKDWWSDGVHRRMADELEGIWNEVEAMQAASVANAQWEEFKQKSRSQIEAISSQLRTTAKSFPQSASGHHSRAWWTASARRKLITAADTLRSITDELPQVTTSAASFRIELEQARSLISRRVTATSSSQSQDELPGNELSPLVVSFVVIDITIILVAVTFWLRKRTSAN